MPYITTHRRIEVNPFDRYATEGAGELAYQLQTLIEQYLCEYRLRFQTISDITGALHQVQRDFDERIVAPYEARKREENGDVWEPWSEYL